MTIQTLTTLSPSFDQQLNDLLAWSSVSDQGVVEIVTDILVAVKQRGDEAVIEYTNQFDRRCLASSSDFVVTQEQLQTALKEISEEQRQALATAAQRIRSYHEHQIQASWQFTEEDGSVFGQKVTPMDRVGLYVPGGKASYPSSVLMNAIPAKVAGDDEVVMVVPSPDDE